MLNADFAMTIQDLISRAHLATVFCVRYELNP
jgi:hypothetical protein